MIERVRQYEPLFGNWWVDQLIGAGSFGRVYRIKREEFGEIYLSALKIITIPADANETEQLLLEGMDQTSVSTYYESMIKDLSREIRLMSHLRGHSNIVSYEDHLIKAHDNGTSWDILIRMELMTRLNTYLREHAPTRSDIIRLGIDLARALDLCQKYNIIHRDIKPDNIFVSPNGDFKLGDFGIARQMERTTGNMSRKGTHFYMAPEVYLEKSYASNVDIYSLGIVMYRLLNGNRLPFMPDAPNPILPQDRDLALLKRIGGEPLPMPRDAQGRLGEIVLKACAYDPTQRHTSPEQLMSELTAILYEETDSPLIYPLGDAMQLTPTSTDQLSATNRTRRSIEIKTETPDESSGTSLLLPDTQQSLPDDGFASVSAEPHVSDQIETEDDEKTCSAIFIQKEPTAKDRVVPPQVSQDPQPTDGLVPLAPLPVVLPQKNKKRSVMWAVICCLLLVAAGLVIGQIVKRTAVDTQTTYPVVAVSNDSLYGSVEGGSLYAAGSNVTLKAVPNEGYKFVSWDDGQEQPEREIRVRGEIALEAIFEPISYHIRYHGGDGAEGTGIETTHRYGESVTVSSNPFRLAGMKFVGWSWEAGGQIDFLEGQPVINLALEEGAIVALYAVWADDNLISISLVADQAERGQVSGSGTYEKGSAVTIVAEPHAGYRFVYWSDQSEEPSRTLTATDDLSLVAYFEPQALMIRLDGNGGTVSINQFEIGMGLPVPDLPVPLRKGYTFTGWFTADNDGDPVKTADVFNHPELTALFARWQAKEFVVAFDANGGTVALKNQSVTYGSAYQTMPTPSRQGYTFGGWFTSVNGGDRIEAADLCVHDGNQTLYARWIGEAYKLTYHANGGTVSPDSKTIRTGESYGQLPVPQRTGYAFQGWSAAQNGSQPVKAGDVYQTAGNQTLYAQWQAKTYSITFDAAGGSSSAASKSATFGAAIGILPDATRTGHSLRGWFTSRSGGTRITADAVYSLDGNQTLYAQWQANTYTVTLNGNGGSVTTSTVQVTYGQTYGQLPTPNHQGHNFTGWFTASSGGTSIGSAQVYQQTSHQTLYAQWQAHTYAVTYHANGGSNAPASQTKTYQVNLTLSSSVPNRSGYDFRGWATSSGSSTVAYAAGATYQNNASLNLYAVWSERAIFLGSTSSYAKLNIGLCNYYPNGSTSYSFTFYTGSTIPNNGAIYQYGSTNIGMSIYFSNARIAVYTVFTKDSIAYKNTHVGSYALSPNTKYTVDMTFTYSNKRIQLTIRDANGSQLSSQTFTGYQASNVTTSGIFGANGTEYNKSIAPRIYLLRATLNGTHYSTGQYQLRTFTFNAATTALGTTSVTSNNIRMTCSGTSVQYR